MSDPDWKVEIPMNPDGIDQSEHHSIVLTNHIAGSAMFEKLGIFKGLEEDRVARVTDRQIHRREEQGSAMGIHEKTEIKTHAQQESKVVSLSTFIHFSNLKQTKSNEFGELSYHR